ncbi:hypothetical protein TI04_04920 [Achromatium sp. WMS2]|nr:hypothetical protein TI04_04920 [Achromatium sp. WMS2]
MYIRHIASGLLAASICVSSAYGEVYRWVDSYGQAHFSDIETSDSQVPPNPEPSVTNSPRSNNTVNQDAGMANSEYEEFRIASPGNNQVLRTDRGQVMVEMLLNPRLKDKHRIQMYLDGGRVKSNLKTTQFVLYPLASGTHKVYAVVVDANDIPKAIAPTISFHLIVDSTTNIP